MSTLISIDYDFFIPHGMYDESEVYLPANDSTMPGMFVYDWQMGESRPPAFEDAIWRGRCAGFRGWGLDIEKLTAPPLSVEDFMTELSIKMEGNAIPAFRGDSHAWAGPVARDYSGQYGPLSVVNFDAHHDLGYPPISKSDRISCEDWALVGLREGWIADYTVVYPDWLGMAEWKGVRRRWLTNFKSQIKTTTWSRWLKTGEIDEPEIAFMCRSSAWTPPWLDQGFQDLCEEFGYAECLDCRFGQTNSPHDTCKLREWDWANVEEEMKIRDEMIERVKTMNKEGAVR